MTWLLLLLGLTFGCLFVAALLAVKAISDEWKRRYFEAVKR